MPTDAQIEAAAREIWELTIQGVCSDPDDKTLLEFVARFAGWDDLVWGPASGQLRTRQNVSHSIPDNDAYVPDYLHSVDAWLRDVWPKVEGMLSIDWLIEMVKLHNPNCRRIRPSRETPRFRELRLINADARSRCLALYRALEGRLQRHDQSELGLEKP